MSATQSLDIVRKQRQQRAVNWCFTLNNYTDEDQQRLQLIECKYLIYGIETAPETGTPHLQGFIVLNDRKTFVTVKSMIGERCHLEKAMGTVQQNIQYCKKEGNYFEKGNPPEERNEAGGRATKRKWTEARNAAKEGRFEDIPDDLWIKYKKSFKEEFLENYDAKPINGDLKHHMIWLYGETGTGKSTAARQLAEIFDKENKPYLKGLHKWWTNYDPKQKVVIIEEAHPAKCRVLGDYFKKWADRWEFDAETKGGNFKSIRPEYVIVTSNYKIEECFDTQDVDPLLRRFNQIARNYVSEAIPVEEPPANQEAIILDENTQLPDPHWTQDSQGGPSPEY